MSGLNQALASLSRLLLRVLLAGVALLFVLSLLAAVCLLAAVWFLRAAWGRLTGRPVAPFVRRFDLGAGFSSVMRRADGAARPGSGPASEVIDVQARDVPGSGAGGVLPPH